MNDLIRILLWAVLSVGLAVMLAFVGWTILRGFQLQLLEILYRKQLHHQDFQGALQTIQRSLRISPSDALLYQQRARVYTQLGDLEAAETDYTQGMRYGQGTSASTNYVGRAAVRFELGRYQEALVDANHAIACSRLWWRGYYERGRVYAALDHPAIALEDFNQAFELTQQPPAELYLARAEAATKLGDQTTAEQDREKAAQL